MYVCVRVTVCKCHNLAFVCPDSRCMWEFLFIRTWSPAIASGRSRPRSASQHPSIPARYFSLVLILWFDGRRFCAFFSRRETLLKREERKGGVDVS